MQVIEVREGKGKEGGRTTYGGHGGDDSEMPSFFLGDEAEVDLKADLLVPLLSFFIACRHIDLIVGSFSWYVGACAKVDPRDLELG